LCATATTVDRHRHRNRCDDGLVHDWEHRGSSHNRRIYIIAHYRACWPGTGRSTGPHYNAALCKPAALCDVVGLVPSSNDVVAGIGGCIRNPALGRERRPVPASAAVLALRPIVRPPARGGLRVRAAERGREGPPLLRVAPLCTLPPLVSLLKKGRSQLALAAIPSCLSALRKVAAPTRESPALTSVQSGRGRGGGAGSGREREGSPDPLTFLTRRLTGPGRLGRTRRLSLTDAM